MHAGNILNNTAAGRVYRFLKRARGCWRTTKDIGDATKSQCVSTRISEVRRQLDKGRTIEKQSCVIDGERRFRYRLVAAGRRAA